MHLAMPDSRVEPILYTQAGCAESAKVRGWLTDSGIAYTERDAARDRDSADALVATGIFATPLLVVGGETILGFQPDALAALLLHGKGWNVDDVQEKAMKEDIPERN
jgi:arsenate reductase-like glutaredoxin family protein